VRLELIPVVLGVLVLLVAAAIVYDAIRPDDPRPHTERRRRQRAELDIPGEWLVGLGTACLGVSLIGNELWRWTTIAVISGIVLIVLGAILNRDFLKEMLLFRGRSRRSERGTGRPEMKLRIR
jgi:hypothetical protein